MTIEEKVKENLNQGGIDMETKFNFKAVPQIWNDYKVLFVFSDDGRVSCRLSFYNDTPQEAFISDLYVHESIRKQGGATSILNWCYECAKDYGCNSISLQSDNDDWVRQWYMRLGFEVKSSQMWLTKTLSKE